jgi:hypothetical protein
MKCFRTTIANLENVVSVGLPGISKSTEINKFLMQYLANLGKPGWPKEVLCRYPYEMVKFFLDENRKAKRFDVNRQLSHKK